MQLTNIHTDTLPERIERAQQIINRLEMDLYLSRQEAQRWKKRHADLSVSSCLIAGGLGLLVLALSISLVMRLGA